MTVDIKRMTAHLPQQQQDAIAKAYHKQAENETAAFLWCFFLGWMGAHRFYLRQWGQGFFHLLVALIAVVIILVGVIFSLDPTIVVVAAIPFALAAFIWEFIDLFRIDDQISARNLKKAEVLIAESLLSDRTVEQQAQAKLDEVLHQEIVQPAGTSAAQVVSERYEAKTVTQESDDPNATQRSEQPVQPGAHDWSTTTTAEVPAGESASVAAKDGVNGASGASGAEVAAAGVVAGAAAVEGAHLIETTTQAHTEAGYGVTDSKDTVVTEAVPQAEAAPETITADMTPITEAEANATTWPNHPVLDEAALAAPLAAEPEVATPAAPEPVAPVSAEPAAAFAPVMLAPDVTDNSAVDAAPVADVGTADATPHMVSFASAAVAVPSLEDATDMAAPPAEAATIPAESYIPPIVPVVENPAPAAAPAAPAEENLAELAGLATAGAVGAGVAAAAAETPAEPAVPEPVAVPVPVAAPAEPHKMLKRIRMTRQIKLNGEVIEETSAEELVDADADPEPVRQRLHEKLHSQAAARMAELGIQDQATVE